MPLVDEMDKEWRRCVLAAFRTWDDAPDPDVVNDLVTEMRKAYTTGIHHGLREVSELTDKQRLAVYDKLTR